jgi:quercetin dioxygenase-like cupin family protein
MILSKNTEVEARIIKSVEGKLLQGKVVLKPMMMGEQMTLLEIQYAAGAGTPTHVHQHESVVYVVKGKVKMIVGKEEYTLNAGDVCRHPQGVPHSVEGIEDSLVVEIKSPTQPLEQFLGT